MKIILPCLFVVASHILFAQSADSVFMFSYFKGNGEDGLHLAYSHDGYNWHALRNDSSFLKPTAGKDKLMRDPCIVQGPDGIFHMVWTVSWNEKGIGYANSRDLINWSTQQYLPVMEHEPGARNCWAPELFYDEKSEQFMIYWATTIAGQFKDTQREQEQGYNHRMYFATSRDFMTLSKTSLLYEPGFNVIDATVILHDKKYLMFLKDETVDPPQKNIRVAVSEELFGGYSTPGIPITGKYWAEGPTVLRIGSQWVVFFDKYRDHQMGAVASGDLKSWIDISERISFPQGVRHGTAFKVSRDVFDSLK